MSSSQHFYARKRDKIRSFLAHLTQAEHALREVMELDLTSPTGEDPDVRLLLHDLEALIDFGESIHEAVDVMVEE